MIRSLTPDELPWFVGRALEYLGHTDPNGLSRRLAPSLKDPVTDASRAYVLARGSGMPSAGVYLRAPAPDEDDQTLRFDVPWHLGDPDGLRDLTAELLDRNPHDAAVVGLHGLGPGRASEVAGILAGLRFVTDAVWRLAFDLADVPPLGMPLVLEAWTPGGDGAFRDLYERAEARRVTDRYWSFLKRRKGSFQPDLWFMARTTLDLEPVGYAFATAERRGVDASYALNAVGVLQEHRGDSEMLRRLVLSTLHELAGSSPFGKAVSELSGADPKLIRILGSLGFETLDRWPVLLRLPA